MDELMIEFYKEKDEQAFLDKWQEKFGPLNEDQIDVLYTEIADAIDEEVKTGEHVLGEPFEYQGIHLGKSDFNAFHALYIFEA